MRISSHFPRPLFFTFWLLAPLLAAPAQAGEVDWLDIDNASERRLADPVFGGKIAVVEAGPRDAEPILLIHGLGELGARSWKQTIPVLAETHHVIALDLPGFGRSDTGNHLYSPEQLARAARGVAAELAEQPVTVVGHSLGGAVALAYAHQYPADVKQLVLVDMAGVLHRSVYTAFLGMQGSRWLTGTSIDQDSWLGEAVTGVVNYVENAAITPTLLLNSALMRAQLLGGNPQTIAGYALVAHDFSRALWALNVPTGIIWGEQDPIAPLRTGQMAAAVIPGARLDVLPGVGHTPMLTAPKAFNRSLERILNADRDAPGQALPTPPPGDAADRTCSNSRDETFSGRIGKLRIENCPNTRVENASIGRLEVVGSAVEMINAHVFDGVTATDSRLSLTAGSIRGEPPLLLNNSRVDAAGTRFVGNRYLAHNDGVTPVTLTFSVSRLQTGRAAGEAGAQHLHQVEQLAAGSKR